MVRIGRLRHFVEIQETTAEKDATGSPSEGWATIAQVWASIEPLSGREFIEAAQVEATITHTIRMRYRPDVTTRHRILHDSRAFNVEVVMNPEQRNITLELMCREAA